MKRKQKKSFHLDPEVRGLGVMMEHFDDKLTLVAEQHGDIKKALDAHSKILDAHTEMLTQLMVDIGVAKEDIGFIKHDLRKKIDREEFAALERRVSLLERRR